MEHSVRINGLTAVKQAGNMVYVHMGEQNICYVVRRYAVFRQVVHCPAVYAAFRAPAAVDKDPSISRLNQIGTGNRMELPLRHEGHAVRILR